jgi:hypothetical protein
LALEDFDREEGLRRINERKIYVQHK